MRDHIEPRPRVECRCLKLTFASDLVKMSAQLSDDLMWVRCMSCSTMVSQMEWHFIYMCFTSVMRVILSKEVCSIIVAMKRGWARGAKTKIVEKVMKGDQFFTCMM